MSRLAFLAAGLLLAFAMAGCGERPQVLDYKQGSYQGKPDTPASANPPFNGDKTKWETAIRSRNQLQNEYRRVN